MGMGEIKPVINTISYDVVLINGEPLPRFEWPKEYVEMVKKDLAEKLGKQADDA